MWLHVHVCTHTALLTSLLSVFLVLMPVALEMLEETSSSRESRFLQMSYDCLGATLQMSTDDQEPTAAQTALCSGLFRFFCPHHTRTRNETAGESASPQIGLHHLSSAILNLLPLLGEHGKGPCLVFLSVLAFRQIQCSVCPAPCCGLAAGTLSFWT